MADDNGIGLFLTALPSGTGDRSLDPRGGRRLPELLVPGDHVRRFLRARDGGRAANDASGDRDRRRRGLVAVGGDDGAAGGDAASAVGRAARARPGRAGPRLRRGLARAGLPPADRGDARLHRDSPRRVRRRAGLVRGRGLLRPELPPRHGAASAAAEDLHRRQRPADDGAGRRGRRRHGRVVPVARVRPRRDDAGPPPRCGARGAVTRRLRRDGRLPRGRDARRQRRSSSPRDR